MKKLILATTILGLFATTSSIYASSNNDFGQDNLDVIYTSVNDNADKYGNIVYVGNYGYYDYRVTQHTTNYVAWTSSSTNNWEKISLQGGTYGRVRR